MISGFPQSPPLHIVLHTKAEHPLLPSFMFALSVFLQLKGKGCVSCLCVDQKGDDHKALGFFHLGRNTFASPEGI